MENGETNVNEDHATPFIGSSCTKHNSNYLQMVEAKQRRITTEMPVYAWKKIGCEPEDALH